MGLASIVSRRIHPSHEHKKTAVLTARTGVSDVLSVPGTHCLTVQTLSISTPALPKVQSPNDQSNSTLNLSLKMTFGGDIIQ